MTGKPSSFGPEVIDNLLSDEATKALSAAQGKVLKGQVDEKAAAAHQHEMDGIVGLTAALALKADLVNGKVPVAQLPDSTGSGGVKILLFPGTQTNNFIVPAGGTWLGFMGFLLMYTDGKKQVAYAIPGTNYSNYTWWYQSGGSDLSDIGYFYISVADQPSYRVQKLIACWKIQ